MDQLPTDITINFDEGNLRLLNALIGFVMYGVALDLRVKDFIELFKRPKLPLLGLVSQFVLLPAVTFLLVLLWKPAPGLALGMILVASCPGGNISNFITQQARGNVSLSVSLTALSTALAIVLTPLNYGLWSSLLPGDMLGGETFELSVWSMMRTIVLIIGIPLVLGMLTAAHLPRVREVIRKPVKWLSLLIFFGFLAVAIAGNLHAFTHFIKYVILLVPLHNALALGTGFGWGKLFRVDEASTRSLTIETGIQNSALALVIIFGFFDGRGDMALVAAFWGIWHIVAGLGIAAFWSWRSRVNARGI